VSVARNWIFDLWCRLYPKEGLCEDMTFLSQDASEVTWAECSKTSPRAEESVATVRPKMESKSWCGSYAVTSSKFEPALVGAKSLNTAALMVSYSQHNFATEAAELALC